jgi:hypothetical protein
MRASIFFIGRWATNIALVCLAIAASVKPEDAMSNLSGWATMLRLPAPAWLQSSMSDHVVFMGIHQQLGCHLDRSNSLAQSSLFDSLAPA